MRNFWSMMCAASYLSVSGAAMAQSEVPSQTEVADLDGDVIVVTARRREESNLDVPIAVSAFSGDALRRKGVERVDDLQRLAPSLALRPNSGRRSNSIYEIRGAAGIDSLITSDPAVGVYVDEVYRARAIGTNQSFYDIANVQVLYGPQGTLFGRNSAAGAVLITTKRPTDQFEGQLNAGIGNFDRRELTAVINVPITPTLAVRLAGQRIKRDGYATNVTTGRKLANTNSWSGRGSVSWRPQDSIETTTIGSYYHADERGSFVSLYGYRPCPSATATAPSASCSKRSMPDVPTVDSRTIGQALAQAAVQARGLGRWETALNQTVRDFGGDESVTAYGTASADPREDGRNFSLTNITSISLSDEITLKNIAGYNYTRAHLVTDLDGTPITLLDTYLRTTNRMFSDELQLQGETGRLTWVAGGMYFREKGTDVQNSIQNVYSDIRQRLDGRNTSYAVFAQGTYKLTDKLSLTLGGRYSWDKRYAQYSDQRTYTLAENTLVRLTSTCNLSPALDTDGDCAVQQHASFKQPTYTATIDYKPSRNLLFYAAHRSGYRSGGLQARTALVSTGPAVGGITPVASTPPFNAETVKDVEIGFKGDVRFGGEVRLNTSVALYKAWYKNLQRTVNFSTGLGPTTNPAGAPSASGFFNVGDGTVQGFSAEGTLTLVRGFNVNGAVGYVDGVFTKFRTATAIVRNIPFGTSKWTVAAGVNLTPIDDPKTGAVSFSGNYSYRSSFTTTTSLPEIQPEARAAPQHQLNLSANWEDVMGSRASLQLWMRNVTNERNLLGANSLASNFGIVPGVIGEPRTYGLNVGYKF